MKKVLNSTPAPITPAIEETAIKPLISIDGQEKASALTSGMLRLLIEGEPSTCALITGPAGVGKSHLTDAICQVARENGINLLYIPVASDLNRADSDESLAFIEALSDSANGLKTICVVDEAGGLPCKIGSGSISPMQRVFAKLIYGSGQGWARHGSVEFKGKSVEFNTLNFTLILVTNHPEKIGGFKTNPDAFKRRFLRISLEPYTAEKMRELIPAYFAKKGWKCGADASSAIVNLHRGTFAPIDSLFKVALGQIPSRTLSKADFATILPLCEYTLRGFAHMEIDALKWIAICKGPRKKHNLQTMFPELNLEEFYRHCQAQKVKKAKKKGDDATGKDILVKAPFVVMSAQQEFTATKIGISFLINNAETLRIAGEEKESLDFAVAANG